jgi:hypothetical protein
VIEIFEVRLVNGIADDFNIKVVEIRCGEAFTEVGSCGMNVERLFGEVGEENGPRGVSTSTLWYNSSTFVATHNAGIVSNTPSG